MLKHIIYVLLAANLGLSLWLAREGDHNRPTGSVSMLLNADKIHLLKSTKSSPATGVEKNEATEPPSEPSADATSNTTVKDALPPQTGQDHTAKSGTVCWVLEGMNDRQSASMEVALTRGDIPFRVFRKLVSEPAGYVVVAGPMSNRTEADALRRRAKSNGLDAFVFTRGKWKHGVSLGVFGSRDNALKRQKEAMDKLSGVQITVEQRFRERTENRLYVPVDVRNAQIDASQLNEIARKNEISARWEKKSCADVEFSSPNQ